MTSSNSSQPIEAAIVDSSATRNWLPLALATNLVNWLLLIPVILLLPSLISVAAGLFIFFGIPLALVSFLALVTSSALLIASKDTVNRKLYWGVLISVGICWTIHIIIVAGVMLIFASLG